ncbi:FG-GAP-like repeat-containing protein [Dokdonia sp. Asnod2-E02]|uniref:FG-GAP-like repeat-containing protein n=1 Tax=Dokdonia sp. Asnod2-E02 TaxID=3160574 RepID=UPI003865B716
MIKKRITLLLMLVTAMNLLAQDVYELADVSQADFENFTLSSLEFADVDNDSDVDLLIMGRNVDFINVANLYINDGEGNYSLDQGSNIEGLSSGDLSFGDIDNDNDLDLIVTGRNTNMTRRTELYLNDGSGVFTVQSQVQFESVAGSKVELGDLNNDGLLDVVLIGFTGSEAQTNVYLNTGNATFTEVSTIFEDVFLGDIAIFDADNDTDNDVLITGSGNSNNRVSELYLNNGDGTFIESSNSLTGSISSSVAVADIDSDNDFDIIISGLSLVNGLQEPSTTLYINNGMGEYTASTQSFINVGRGNVVFEDIDNDQDLDIFISGVDEDDAIIYSFYLNDGLGVYAPFVDSNILAVREGSLDFADVNGDGTQDIAITGKSSEDIESSRLYINQEMLGVTNVESNALSVYPNPSNGRFTINIDKPVGQIEIFEISGKLMLRDNEVNDKFLNVNLASGIYLIKAMTIDGEQYVSKIIIE